MPQGQSQGPGDGQPAGPGSDDGQPGGTPRGGTGANATGGRGGDVDQPDAPTRPDDTEPTPPQPEADPSAAGRNDLAPENVPQSDLVLRKIRDLLDNDKVTPDLEERLGMSRQEMEQFVKKFEKAPDRGQPGPGRDIEVKPGQGRNLGPASDLPDVLGGQRVSQGAARQANMTPQDELRGLNEGSRSTVPPELRARFEAYKSSLARSKVVAPASRTPAPPRPAAGATSGGNR